MSSNDGHHPFDEMVRRPDAEFRLAHAALLWARDEYPKLTPARYLERLNALADRVGQDGAHTGYERIEALRKVLVAAESFRGNYEDFANPANSYLNRVIDMRRGIPISLGAVWLDVAGQLNWPFSGVNLPGHFVLRYDGIGEEILVDPFNEGRELSREDCQRIAQAVAGADTVLEEEDLAPAEPRAILARMLGNLYATYVKTSDWPRTIRVLQRLLAVKPDDAMVLAELGRIQTLVGRHRAAAETLDHAESCAQSDEERATIRHHLISLQSRLREQN